MPSITLLLENFPYIALSGIFLSLIVLFFLTNSISRANKDVSTQMQEIKSTITHRIDEIEVYAIKEIKDIIGKSKKYEEEKIQIEFINFSEKMQRLFGDVKGRLDEVVNLCQQMTVNSDLKDEIKRLRADTEEQGLYLHDQFAAVSENVGDQLRDLRDKALADLGTDSREDRAQLQAAVSSMSEMVAQSVNRLTAEVDAKLALLENKLDTGIRERWSEALGTVDALREQMAALAAVGTHMHDFGENIKTLSCLLKVRDGVAGTPSARQQLADLLAQTLPTEHYQLDATLANGNQAAALVRLGEPQEVIVIDADLSLQAFVDSRSADIDTAVRDEKRAAFGRDVAARIDYVAEMAASSSSALLFVASEAAFADIHADHRNVVDLSISRHVWLVSPTTLLAVLNTANLAIKDYQAQQQLRQVREAVTGIIREAQYFENRLNEVGDQVSAAWRSVRRAESASNRLLSSVRGMAPDTQQLPQADNAPKV